MHVLVTRPEPDALRLKGLIEARGYEATIEPLLHVSFADADPVDLEGVTALIATSRNALRALQRHPARVDARDLTIYCVGAATAAEARRMGFGRVIAGAGTGAELVPIIASTLDPAEEMLLHLAGDRLAVDVAGELEAQGFRVARATVYRTVAATRLSEPGRDQLADGVFDAVLLMSPRTAAIWARLVKQDRLEAVVREVQHLCLSDAVAEKLSPLAGVPINVAETPTLEEVLALIDDCSAQSEL